MNKPAEALRNYEDSMAINQRLGQQRGVAASLAEIAQVQLSLGKPDAALSAYNDALKIRQEIGAKKDAGDTLIDLGDLYLERGEPDKALQMFKESLQIQRDTGDDTYQALCLSNIGTAYLQKGETEDGLTYLQQALQIREKLNVPGDIAGTLQHLGSAYSSLGQYDQAMTSYMRSLDLYRKGGDNHGAAVVSHSMGLIFEYQGRLGPAVDALQDAVKAFQALGDRSSVPGDALNDLADALAQSGRGSESAKPLEESKELARDLKKRFDSGRHSEHQGDVRFYQGDLKCGGGFLSAGAAFSGTRIGQRRASNRQNESGSVAIAEAGSHSAISHSTISSSTMNDLRSLVQQADAQGNKYVSVACSVLLGEAMIKDKIIRMHARNSSAAWPEAKSWGCAWRARRIHYLLGTSLRLSGSTGEAAAQYREARNLLDEIRKEQGAEHIIERYDLKPIYADAS